MRTLFLAFMALTVPAWGQSDPAQLSTAQQVVVGGVTGAATATAVQPLLFIKNQFQQRKGLKEIRAEVAKERELLLKQAHAFYERNRANPVSSKALNFGVAAAAPVRVLYRGYPVFAGSLTPVTAVQVMVAGQLANLVGARELDAKEQLAVSAAAGAASAVVASPGELAMLHQQNSGRSLWRTVHALTSQYGLRVLTRGMGATAGREGGFTAGYGAVYPLLKQWLMEVDNGNYKMFAPVVAAVGAGVVTTAITHPFDAAKTALQEDVARKQYRNMWHAAWKMYKADGVRAFTSGILARGAAVTFAVGGMGHFKEKVTHAVVDHNKRSNQA